MMEKIKEKHILLAIQEIEANPNLKKGRSSTKYDLIYNNKAYPPKVVISLANKFATGKELDSKEFHGGHDKPAFDLLKKEGFRIVEKKNSNNYNIINEYISKLKSGKIVASKSIIKLINADKFIDNLKIIDKKFFMEELKGIDSTNYKNTIAFIKNVHKINSKEYNEFNIWSASKSFLKNKYPELVKKHDELNSIVSFADNGNGIYKSFLGEKNLIPFLEEKYGENESNDYKSIKLEQNKTDYLKIEDLNSPLNRILFGPPGTGKTYTSISHAVCIINETDLTDDSYSDLIKNEYDRLVEEGQIHFVTFHQSYSYEEFVEGIKPYTQNGQIFYKIIDGIFKKICHQALKNLEKKYVLIIDEINRGNISRIFGELLTLIEESKRLGSSEKLKIKLAYSGANDSELFGIPNNLYIIGTMNSTDRSIALIDTALRRRFTFYEYSPNYHILKPTKDGIDLNKLLSTINSRIEFLLDKDHLIGQAYFLNLNNKNDLISVFRNKLLPLLEEYFYKDYKKIQLVLGDEGKSKPEAFKIIRTKEISSEMKRFRQSVDGFDDKVIFEIDDKIVNYKLDEIVPQYFKSIYE